MFKFNLVCEQISFFLIWIFQFIIFINFSIYYSKERIYFFIRTYQSIRLEKRRLLLLLILSIILHAVDKSWGVKHFVQTKWIILREKVQLTFISAKTKKKKKIFTSLLESLGQVHAQSSAYESNRYPRVLDAWYLRGLLH